MISPEHQRMIDQAMAEIMADPTYTPSKVLEAMAHIKILCERVDGFCKVNTAAMTLDSRVSAIVQSLLDALKNEKLRSKALERDAFPRIEGTLPVVLYCKTEKARGEIVAAFNQAHPTAHTKKL